MKATNAQQTMSSTAAVQNITTADLLKVYSGKPGCMCGCKGRYYVTAESRAEASADRGYAYDDKDVSAAQVLRVLRLVQAAVAGKPAKLEIEREYVYVEAGGRALAIYFRQHDPLCGLEGVLCPTCLAAEGQ